MNEFTIYHNPRCSKSRETLALLEEAGVKTKVVEYLKDAPTKEEILSLLEKLGTGPASIVRTKEDRYRELKFPLDNPASVAAELSRHPELLERPIVVKGAKAVIGRPPEKVKELL